MVLHWFDPVFGQQLLMRAVFSIAAACFSPQLTSRHSLHERGPHLAPSLPQCRSIEQQNENTELSVLHTLGDDQQRLKETARFLWSFSHIMASVLHESAPRHGGDLSMNVEWPFEEGT